MQTGRAKSHLTEWSMNRNTYLHSAIHAASDWLGAEDISQLAKLSASRRQPFSKGKPVIQRYTLPVLRNQEKLVSSFQYSVAGDASCTVSLPTPSSFISSTRSFEGIRSSQSLIIDPPRHVLPLKPVPAIIVHPPTPKIPARPAGSVARPTPRP